MSAACESGPPSSVTTPAATRKSGERPTSAVRATMISPATSWSASSPLDSSNRAVPSTTPPLAGSPERTSSAPDVCGSTSGAGRPTNVTGEAHPFARKSGEQLLIGAKECRARLQHGIESQEALIDLEGDASHHAEHSRYRRAHPLAKP